ncbi:acyl-CoA dehydrogenase family protein [Rhodococcus wratislaviensis]|uniref:Acyl-CoA dehydrogenase n=1 Tax=Rhodococcus wratislaviensis NBRC 100605 TaxID=1219028 RepID=X0Q7W1_RHOWR|nr:acyl-CoA dehydrogenase family protein [Rhodococcus wratislaviensis]GAF47517.1 hypothetical protein RW1_041_00630 [Rhodococcus wratislaviensis NBRC 100605]
MTIHFDLSPEQQKLKVDARNFARVHLEPRVHRIRTASGPGAAAAVMQEAHQAAVQEFGIIKRIAPPEFGGTAIGGVDAAVMWEELATVMPEIFDSFAGLMLVLGPIMKAGTPEQHQRLLAPLLNGSTPAPVAAMALSEPGGTANFDAPPPAPGLQTTAVRDGDEWVITGDKEWGAHLGGWDGNGPDLMIVICRTPAGISLIAIERKQLAPDNFTVVEHHDTAGLRGTLTSRIRLDNVRVPIENLIGAEGDGPALASQTFIASAAAVAVLATASMRAAFDDAYRFATTETRNGPVPIIDHRVVADVLSQAKGRIEATRLIAWRAMDATATGNPNAVEWCLHAKIFGSETAVDVINQLIRVVGIQAYKRSFPIIHRLFDALAYPIFQGGNISIRLRQLQDLLKSEEWNPLQASGMS